MFNFIFRFIKIFNKVGPDEINGRIEGAIKNAAQKSASIDPDTNVQWLSLKRTLEEERTAVNRRPVITRHYLFKPAVSLAVVSAILVAIGVVWMQRTSAKIYETSKGEQSTVVLQDSTKIILNSLSEISVSRSPKEKERHVSLKGEAMFHVKKNETPFIVTTDVGTVQVMGTKFNVRVRDRRMEVAVLSGKVKMSVKQNGIDSSIILTGGQIAFCSENEFPEAPGILPFADYPGWMKGRLMFYRSAFISICKELEMQYDIEIRVENPEIQKKTLTGVIDGQNAESAVKTLVQVTGTAFSYENGIYNIY
ncbi:MAG: FecR domain-containing protein [Bacteroidetes bacterium]|nr:FecR domain-containing protein [Bacteroidota bacterium]